MSTDVLLDKLRKADEALRDLYDEVMININQGWRPIIGLIGGCIEQLQDVKEEITSL